MADVLNVLSDLLPKPETPTTDKQTSFDHSDRCVPSACHFFVCVVGKPLQNEEYAMSIGFICYLHGVFCVW